MYIFIYIYMYIHDTPPKLRVMESSIRDISICWKLSWGLEDDNLDHGPYHKLPKQEK